MYEEIEEKEKRRNFFRDLVTIPEGSVAQALKARIIPRVARGMPTAGKCSKYQTELEHSGEI
jgi:hypothetical protein